MLNHKAVPANVTHFQLRQLRLLEQLKWQRGAEPDKEKPADAVPSPDALHKVKLRGINNKPGCVSLLWTLCWKMMDTFAV